MATTLVSGLIDSAKLLLQETSTSGTRWKNEEILGWLNEAYQAIIQAKPDANSITEDMALAAGTKQNVPATGLRLLDVVRSTDPASDGMSITLVSRHQLDITRRGWHREDETADIEHYIYNADDPRTFYVFPPAVADTNIEIIYSAVPSKHETTAITSESEIIKLTDVYAPVMLDYILYRAYSKDADHTANANRAMMHYRAYREALGMKVQVDRSVNPNNDIARQVER